MVVLVLQVDKTMNKEQLVVASNSFPTLVQLAGVEVFNIVFNIYIVISKKKYILCYCYNNNDKCAVCRISLFSFGWFKSQVGEIESI